MAEMTANHPSGVRKFFTAPYECFWIAALGLALEGAAGEFSKFAPLPEITQTPLDGLLVRLLVIALVIAVFFIARNHRENFVFKNRMWAVAVCIGFTLGLALYFSGFLFVASGSLPVVLGFYLTTIVGSAFLLIWFDRIFAFGIRATLLTVAASLVIRGLLQMILVLMQQNPGVLLITAMPMMSLPCFLAVFAQSKDMHPEGPNPTNAEFAVASPTAIRYSKLAMASLFLMLFLIPLLIGSSDDHSALIGIDYGLSRYREVSCIGVNIAVGALLFFYAKLHFNKTLLLVYFLVVIAFTATATFAVQNTTATSLITGSLALQAAKKMLDFGVIFPAFIFSSEGQKCYHLHVAGRLCSFSGKLVTPLLLWVPITDTALRSTISVGLLFALFATLIVFFFCLENTLTSEEITAVAETKPLRQPFKEAIAQLAAEKRLTPTEETILTLVARGSNAESVSKELVVSVNTAKFHIRNIYAKMEVHSQQELIALVNETKDAIRNTYED